MKDKTPYKWVLSLTMRAPTFIVFLTIFLLSSQAFAQWVKQTGLTVTKISTIAVDPQDPNRMFAGTDFIETNQSLSGLYTTSNGGLTWAQVTSASMAGRAIRSIAIAPGGTATNRKIFAAVSNQGIFKSLNSGLTWTTAHIQNPVIPGSFLTQNISQIVATGNGAFSGKIYAVVKSDEQNAPGSAGIYFSTNDGVTWQKASNNLFQKVIKLVVPITQPETLYILTDTNELMKSTNGGSSFIAANSGLPTGIGAQVVDFVIDPNNPNNLYASAQQNGVRGTYQSNNGGLSWTVVNSTEVFHKLAVGTSSVGTISPTLYGIKNESLSTVPSYSVYTSTNGGTTWTELDPSFSSQLSTQTLNVIEVSNNTVYAGGQEGMYVYGGSSGGIGNGLNLTAFASPQTITPNQPVTFNLSLNNTSGTTQSNVTVTSTPLPIGTTNFVSTGTTACTMQQTTRVVSCSVFNMPVSGTSALSFSVRLPATQTTSLPVSFSATGTGVNANTSVTLLASGSGGTGNGLNLTALATPTTITPNQPTSFSLSLSNTSGTTQSNVTVTSGPLPFGTTGFVSTGSTACTMQQTTRVVSCSVFNMPVNGTSALSFSVRLPSSQTTSLPVSFSATGTGVNANTSVTLLASGTGGVGNGLNLTGLATPTTITPNQPTSFSLSLSNTSGTTQSSVTVSSGPLPFGTTGFVSTGTTACTLQQTTRVVTCNVINMPVNGNSALSFSVRLPATQTTSLPLTFTATGTGTNASTTITVLGSGGNGIGQGVTLNVTSTVATVSASQLVPINVSLTNTSGALLSNINVSSNSLPIGTTMSPNNFCQFSISRTVTCTVTSIQTGFPTNLSINLTMPPTVTSSAFSINFTATGTGVNASDNLTLSVSNSPGNGTGPTALPVTLTTSRNVPINGFLNGVGALSTDTLTYRFVNTTTTKGRIEFSGTPNVTQSTSRNFTYTPNLNATGIDTFSYVVETGVGTNRQTSAPATITITINNTPGQSGTGSSGPSSSGGAINPLVLMLLALPLLFRRRS